MDINDSAQSSGSSLLAKRAAEGSNGDVVQVEHEAAAQMTKRPRLDGESKPEDARVHSLRGDESEPASPSNSRQSSPSMQSPNTSLATPAADKSFGGAKRRGDDGRKALPRNIDRVYYGEYDIKTWYHSPYPLEDDHSAAASSGTNGSPASGNRTASSSKLKIKIRSSGQQSAASNSEQLNGNQQPAPTSFDPSAMPPPSLPSSSSSSSLAPPSTPSSSLTSKPTPPPPTPRVPHLWICEGCFKYTRSYAAWYAHKHKECKQHHPPGRKVYQRGSHIIWEVDGAKEKLYAQNLSLFGKLFIDHKTIYFDVEPFVFYIVTDAATASFDYVLGFFSKEKVSYDDYNLACIITFPPFQKKGFGTLMIEYSYHLSLTSGIAGTPERPLSELGFKGYLSYWSAVVLRTLALALDDDDADIAARLLPLPVAATGGSGSSPSKKSAMEAAAASNSQEASKTSKEQQKAAARIRAALLFGTSPLESKEAGPSKAISSSSQPSLSSQGDAASSPATGDDREQDQQASPGEEASASTSSTTRVKLDRAARHLLPHHPSDKPATTSIAATATSSSSAIASIPRDVPCLATTLERLSIAANLRVEDTAFALAECGLLKMRMKGLPEMIDGEGNQPLIADAAAEAATATMGEGDVMGSGKAVAQMVILVTRDAVRKAMRDRGVKRPVLEMQYVFA